MSKEIRALIFQMVAENPTWGAPAFMASCSSWASIYRNQRFRAGCGEPQDFQIPPGAG